MKKNFYLTTPIYYVNDTPHIGHICTTLVADVLARYHRQKGDDVFFLTGTDEHGSKIAQSAQKAGLTPQKFCDQVSSKFRRVWKKLNISHDFFVRTTDPRHEKIVTQVLKKIYQKGDIYRGKYQGLYCIGCEKFLTETDLVNGHCPLHPPEQTVKAEEESWFFKLSRYVPQINKLIENEKTNYIFPEGKRREILAKLKKEVHDISFSRAKVSWGIPVPWDKTQTIYVWIEALLNYYTATQFLKGKKKFWPADLHLLGKDILWFHSVIWQAILLSAGLPLPKRIFAHSFYLIDQQKISKSRGKLISDKDLLARFGVDGSRYLVTASFPYENDSSVSLSKFIKKYNADLANNLGNLISRVGKLAVGEKVTVDLPSRWKPFFLKGVAEKIEAANTPEALFKIWNNPQNGITAINRSFNQKQIWKQKGEKLKKELNLIFPLILNIAYNIRPFMPDTGKKIEKLLSPGKPAQFPSKPLFPRIKER